MCNPLAIVAVASIASTAVSTVGAIKQSNAQKQTVKFQSTVARNNQIIANRQAEDTRLQGEQAERDYRKKLEFIKSKQRSGFAGSGVVVDSDTPFEMLGDIAYLGEIDAAVIRNNADRQAYGFETQGLSFATQSELYKTKAENISPFFSGGATLLGGLTATAGTVAAVAALQKGGD